MTATDLVVLLDENGTPIGSAPRTLVHTDQTPLHLAFSCHLLDDDGRTLVTRRALGKRTWPGVWTNSFCGHPRPGEDLAAAVSRRAQEELGIALDELRPALPDFRYRAEDAGGVVENEVCPVFIARTRDPVVPDPEEVAEALWVDAAALGRAVRDAPWAFSPWLVLQSAALPHLGGTEPG